MHHTHTNPCTIQAHTENGKEANDKAVQTDTYMVIVWIPSKHTTPTVHTGAPSRCWSKGTRVDIQIARLHSPSMSKATEWDPGVGVESWFLGDMGNSGARGTLSRSIYPLSIFILSPGISHSHWVALVLLPQRGLGGWIKSVPVFLYCIQPRVSSSNISGLLEACPGHQQNMWGRAPAWHLWDAVLFPPHYKPDKSS